MFSKCPGQDMRKLRVELFKCTECGAEVEIFSDETRIKCQKCGTMIFKEQLPTCIEWCSAARQCLGEERWTALMGDKENSVKTKAEKEKPLDKQIED
jgi:DNA-directed RNA polymerase subunit RPC12/RpoP